jgi:hypothetical protein
MKVKQLKELLEQVDENLEIVVYDEEDIAHTINLDDSGEVIFSENDEKHDIRCFMIRVEY